MHVHVHCGDGEAKFWLEPKVALAKNYGLTKKTGWRDSKSSRGAEG